MNRSPDRFALRWVVGLFTVAVVFIVVLRLLR